MPENQKPDFLLYSLHHPVNLFQKLEVFDEMVGRCRRHGYFVHEFDCRQFKAQEDILNALLDCQTEEKREYFYKNIMMIQFWDLFTNPWLGNNGKALLAFRYYDTFHRLDPVCSQEMMKGLIDAHYRGLLRGDHFLICAHWVDTSAQLDVSLVKKPAFNTNPCFSEKYDEEVEKSRKAEVWWKAVHERLLAEGVEELRPHKIVAELQDRLGLRNLTDLYDANPSFEELLALAQKLQTAAVWWRELMERFISEAENIVYLKHSPFGLRDKVGLRTVTAFYDANIPTEELKRLTREFEVEEDERRSQSTNRPRRIWLDEVVACFNARSEIQITCETLGRALKYIGSQEGKVEPTRLNSTPEEAAEQMLKITPEKMKSFMRMKSMSVRIEDRYKVEDEQA